MPKNKPQPDDFWETPPEIFEPLNAEFNFDLDACATKETTKVPNNFFTIEDDALSQDWHKKGKVIWCNPPYSKAGSKDLFIKKAYEESLQDCTVVMLLPVKTSTKAFHEYIYNKPNVTIRFLKGRPKFLLNGTRQGSGRNDIMVVILNPVLSNKDRDLLLSSLNNPPEPNEALKDLLKKARLNANNTTNTKK